MVGSNIRDYVRVFDSMISIIVVINVIELMSDYNPSIGAGIRLLPCMVVI